MSAIAITESSFHPATTLADQITELAAHLDAGQYQLLRLIERFDREEGWAGAGVRSCAHWLSWQCGMNLGAARERVRVARALPALPQISAVFAEGRISYSKVRAMTRVATPANEDVLLNVALHGTASHVETQVRTYRRFKRVEALDHARQQHFQRQASCRQDVDGSFILRARLTPEQGALVAKALERAGIELFEETRNEPDDVSAETPRAPIDMAIPNAAASSRADALVRVAEAYLGGAGTTADHADCTVHIHTDIETLKDDGEGAESTLDGHGNVSTETSRRLSCDAGVVHWLDTHKGQPMSIGRKSRTVPPAIRRALQRRDGGCRFPGCSCKRFVDAHHIHHWADGGETALDNLVLLCRNHHRKVHEDGFGVHMKDGQPVFTLPSGTVLPESPETRFRGNVLRLKRGNRQSGVAITPSTAIPRWQGESTDVDLVIQGLIARE